MYFITTTTLRWCQYVYEVKDRSFTNSGDDWWGENAVETYENMAMYTDLLIETSKVFTYYKVDVSLLLICLSIRILALVQFQPKLAFFTQTLHECSEEMGESG